ncbi:MAG: GNAT family N-acetyltransferase [Cytophagales bacterium]|nr:GNAT family N-acetyltransferase [Armatimonadota bacterium]
MPTGPMSRENDGNQPMTMTRASLADLPARPPLPEGITIRAFTGSAEAARWTAVQRDAEPFLTISDDLFVREFGSDDAAIASRCLAAVETTTGEMVAAASAWHGGDPGARGEDWGRLHWVAVRPAYQRRGIARALVVECLHRMVALGHGRAYLVTSTGRHGAIALYESVGFATDRP